MKGGGHAARLKRGLARGAGTHCPGPRGPGSTPRSPHGPRGSALGTRGHAWALMGVVPASAGHGGWGRGCSSAPACPGPHPEKDRPHVHSARGRTRADRLGETRPCCGCLRRGGLNPAASSSKEEGTPDTGAQGDSQVTTEVARGRARAGGHRGRPPPAEAGGRGGPAREPGEPGPATAGPDCCPPRPLPGVCLASLWCWGGRGAWACWAALPAGHANPGPQNHENRLLLSRARRRPPATATPEWAHPPNVHAAPHRPCPGRPPGPKGRWPSVRVLGPQSPQSRGSPTPQWERALRLPGSARARDRSLCVTRPRGRQGLHCLSHTRSVSAPQRKRRKRPLN